MFCPVYIFTVCERLLFLNQDHAHVRLGQPEETSSGRIGVKVEESVETLTFRNPPGALAPPEAEGNVGSLPGRRRFRPKGDFALENVSQIC